MQIIDSNGNNGWGTEKISSSFLIEVFLSGGDGKMGRWGDGEMGRWGSSKHNVLVIS
ncbi:hypothetical protein [Okeania sp. SIO2C2]|uniref:hypothetical protein n=1 Tax=Okeania sp. SIO2C2 TaxID=2607787 RepID=UPI00257E0453|nr:hypothetical protein [Okeania sp. SIO2C2]